MVEFGCFGTEVDADVIEARKQALRDWWTPARRQAASDQEKARWTPEMRQAASERWTPDMRKTASEREKARWTPEMRQTASDWWTDARRDDHSDFMANWWSDEEEGAARREAKGMSAYLQRAAQRGDPNPPAPICLPAGTHCPACGDALGNRVIVYIEVQAAQGSRSNPSPIIRFTCPHKTCASLPYITDATKRAAVIATIPDGEGGDELEKAIVERMVLAVDRFNCALAKKKGAAFKPYLLPAFVTLSKGPRADDIVLAENGEERFQGCFHCGQQFPSATGHWMKGPAGTGTLCTCCGVRFGRGLPFTRQQRDTFYAVKKD
mmetsp:Transcript_9186/g.41850  ORF Transcript_9186/g.41850 Transcript_9186/m.41850 type:complete len:322 (+) Transcript_9186:819-1784(+)